MVLWDQNLWLLSREEFHQLPDGTELISILGERKIKGQDSFNFDSRMGYLAYGVRDPFNHELKDLFLIFALKS